MFDYLRLIYRAWRYRLRDDKSEIRELRRLLRKGDVAIDIGCHKGAYLFWMRSSVGYSGRIMAFEPQPALAQKLDLLIRFCGWKNVTLYKVALSSGESEADLYLPKKSVVSSPGATLESLGDASDHGTRTVRVRTLRLDNLLPARRAEPSVRLIKCDVEGHELDVFRGAEQLLRREGPILLFECEQRHHKDRDMSEVFEFLQSLRYEGQFFGPGDLLYPIAEFDSAIHQQPGKLPYCNNFLFRREV